MRAQQESSHALHWLFVVAGSGRLTHAATFQRVAGPTLATSRGLQSLSPSQQQVGQRRQWRGAGVGRGSERLRQVGGWRGKKRAVLSVPISDCGTGRDGPGSSLEVDTIVDACIGKDSALAHSSPSEITAERNLTFKLLC